MIFEEYLQTTIGSDVWIGDNVIINGGIIVGHGAVIAAGAIVTKNVNPYEIVGGVPAKTIRKRFEPNIITSLLEIEWWNCNDKALSERMKFNASVNDFLQNFKKHI